jgi:hypothetical protein
METGTWKIEHFTMKRNKVAAIRLKEFEHLRQLKGNGAAWAYSVTADDMISEITKRNKGEVIIKKENIGLNDFVVICVEGDYFAVQFSEIADYIVRFTAWTITAITAKKLMDRKEFYLC